MNKLGLDDKNRDEIWRTKTRERELQKILMAFGLLMINCNHLSLNLMKLMIKIYEALPFAANCRAAENTRLGPGAWNADVWYYSNCERTLLPKHSHKQNSILSLTFLLIHSKTASKQNTMVIVTHLNSAVIKQCIALIACWRCFIMNSACCLPQSDSREKNRVTVCKAHLTVGDPLNIFICRPIHQVDE